MYTAYLLHTICLNMIEKIIFFSTISDFEVVETDFKRPDSNVFSGGKGAIYQKNLSEIELNNYSKVDRKRFEFSEGDPIVVFPKIITCSSSLDCKMTSPPLFHFRGQYDLSVEAYSAVITALDRISQVFTDTDLQIFDYESEEHLLVFLNEIFENIPQLDRSKIKSSISSTKDCLTNLPFLPSHGDAHVGNWSFSLLNWKPVISFIDMETLGLYRRGWDLGRMYALLSGHNNDQINLLSAISSAGDSFSELELKYFWRTVLIRSLRNLYRINAGTLYNELTSQDRDNKFACTFRTINQVAEILS
jgi:hypothetical protein